MSSDVYYGFIVVLSILCFLDWRKGLYLCLLVDVLRDPVRKLIEDQPVFVTVAGAVPWGAVTLGAMAMCAQFILARSTSPATRSRRWSRVSSCMTLGYVFSMALR